jgi:hypothetical protein
MKIMFTPLVFEDFTIQAGDGVAISAAITGIRFGGILHVHTLLGSTDLWVGTTGAGAYSSVWDADGITGDGDGITGAAVGTIGDGDGITGAAVGTIGDGDGITGAAVGTIGDGDGITGAGVGTIGDGDIKMVIGMDFGMDFILPEEEELPIIMDLVHQQTAQLV